VVLITHGMPVRPVARLCYDLAVVHCAATRQIYLEEGCRLERVFMHGRRQHHAPMPAGPLPDRLNVGIFLCKDVNEGRRRAVVGRGLVYEFVERLGLDPDAMLRFYRRTSEPAVLRLFANIDEDEATVAARAAAAMR